MASPLAGIAFQNAVTFGVYGAVIDWTRKRRHHRADGDSGTVLEGEGDAWTDAVDAGIAGSFAGGVVTLLTSPVELVKIRMQIQENALGSHTTSGTGGSGVKGGQVVYRGSWHCAQHLVQQHGVQGVMRGIVPTFWREWPATGSYFMTYEYLKRYMTPKGQETSHTTLLFAGGVAGIVSWVITYPFDIIKTRIQEHDRNTTMVQTAKELTQGGRSIAPLFRGMSAAILRAFPVNAACFWAYEVTMKFLEAPS
eukprot:TRINITY_DN3205_c0_g7_i3.p1 TRINITY_DN3205_c0_g7~~TRINITY_DN3205_c0_g7_i3.p1  ORF type:complete len:252 (+),score=21.87 TRINITY_DN3205_c0_g7_i3:575-1330(+)